MKTELSLLIDKHADHEKEKRRRRNWIIAAVAVFVLAILGVAAYIWRQNNSLKESVSRSAARSAELLIEEGDSYRARQVALEALEMAYTPEAEAALRHAWMQNSAVLRGHTGYVNKVSYSPDGKLIVSVSQDKTARIWDVETGSCLHVLYGDTSFKGRMNGDTIVYSNLDVSAAFSPDSKLIVTTVSDTSIPIWDVATGKCLRRLVGHKDIVHSVAFSPDGKYIASASYDTTLRLWNVQTGQCMRSQNIDVGFVEFSPDGKHLLTDYEDNTLRIWDVLTGECIKKLSGHSDFVFSAVYSPNGEKIVSLSWDDGTRVWDAQTGKCLWRIEDGISASFSPDGNSIVISSSENFGIAILDAKTGKRIRTMNDPVYKVAYAEFSPDGKQIVTSPSLECNGLIRIWNIDTILCTHRLCGKHDEYYTSLAFNPSGKYILASTGEKKAVIWDVKTSHSPRVIDIDSYRFLFSPDCQLIVSLSDDHSVNILDVKTGKCVRTLKERVYRMDMSPDGKRIITLSFDTTNIARIWDVETGKCLHEYEISWKPDMVKFGPDNRLVYSKSKDTLFVFDSENGTCVKKVILPSDGGIWELSSDCKLIALIELDMLNTLSIVDAVSGKRLSYLHSPNADFSDLNFSPDGNFAVTTAFDNTARVWNVHTGECVWTIKKEGGFDAATFTPDGRQIAISLQDEGVIEIYDFPPLEELIQKTRAQFKDNPLTPEERRQYYLE